MSRRCQGACVLVAAGREGGDRGSGGRAVALSGRRQSNARKAALLGWEGGSGRAAVLAGRRWGVGRASVAGRDDGGVGCAVAFLGRRRRCRGVKAEVRTR